MSIQDDIFDVARLIEQHGDEHDARAWDNLTKWAFAMEEKMDKANHVLHGIGNIRDTLPDDIILIRITSKSLISILEEADAAIDEALLDAENCYDEDEGKPGWMQLCEASRETLQKAIAKAKGGAS